jgi:hypothetical protein
MMYMAQTLQSKYTYLHGVYMYIQVHTSKPYFAVVYTCIHYVHTCMDHISIFHTCISRYVHQMFSVQIGTDNFYRCSDSFELSAYTDIPFLSLGYCILFLP